MAVALEAISLDKSFAFTRTFALPDAWTFKVRPIRMFIERHRKGFKTIVDPFCGRSRIGRYRNDLAKDGVDAEEYCWDLLKKGVIADLLLFDPPYSPTQIKLCYNGIGLEPTDKDTQNSALYARVRKPMSMLLRPGGTALSFGWNSTGFGKQWPINEILLVQHGGGHFDTICVAQTKPY